MPPGLISRPCLILLSVWLFLGAGRLPANAETRLAWTVGVDDYQHANKLKNGVSATKLIGEYLGAAGFEVDPQYDVDKAGFEQGFDRFLAKSASADLRILYFSGHGVETGGVNYLLPKDAAAGSEAELRATSISLNEWIKRLSQTRAGTDILILDCCRSSPFSESGSGLADVPPVPDHTLLLFAAQPGKVAYDLPLGGARVGEPVSPFTLALVESFSTPHDSLLSLFGEVTRIVMSDTNNQQEPYIKFSGNISSLHRARIYAPRTSPSAPEVSSPWFFPHSRHALLTHEELNPLSAEELWRARNEIFARHGYRFKTEKGRAFASSLDPRFYRPLKDDVQDYEMTPYEVENVALIKQYEDALNAGHTVTPSRPNTGSVWLIPNSSTAQLRPTDLAGLSRDDLWVARNEIFARRGLIFQSDRGKALCRRLGSVYQPVSSDQNLIYDKLNTVEQANVDLIARFELGAGPAASYPMPSSSSSSSMPSGGGAWMFPDSGQRYLTDAELRGLSSSQLRWARNEIYARHGYIFSSDFGKTLTRQLGSDYRPVSRDMSLIESRMNQFERANIEKISRYE